MTQVRSNYPRIRKNQKSNASCSCIVTQLGGEGSVFREDRGKEKQQEERKTEQGDEP